MAKPEWGAKRVCGSCGVKYYDMQRNPITCPSCGEKAPTVTARSRRGRGPVKPEPEVPKKAQPEDKADKVDIPGDDEADTNDGDGDGDDSLLENDDDDDKTVTDVIAGGGTETDAKDT